MVPYVFHQRLLSSSLSFFFPIFCPLSLRLSSKQAIHHALDDFQGSYEYFLSQLVHLVFGLVSFPFFVMITLHNRPRTPKKKAWWMDTRLVFLFFLLGYLGRIYIYPSHTISDFDFHLLTIAFSHFFLWSSYLELGWYIGRIVVGFVIFCL
jgi:hypothetical protein